MQRAAMGWLLGIAALTGCTERQLPPITAAGPLKCDGSSVKNVNDLAKFAGCRHIRGRLALSGIDDLTPLSALSSVDGELSIAGIGAESLWGLQHLRSVDSIVIDSNPKLDDITALRGVSHARRVILGHNPMLTSPRGLEGLTFVDELSIQQSGLVSLAGLENLRHIGKLDISDNHLLVSMNALRSVTHIDELVLERNSRICGKGGLLTHLERPPLRSVIDHNPTLFPKEYARLHTDSLPLSVAATGLAGTH